jgi:hypothetical protein
MRQLVIDAKEFADICDVSVYNIELWYDIEMKSPAYGYSLTMETIEFLFLTLKRDVIAYARDALRKICKLNANKTYGYIFLTQPFHVTDKYCNMRIAIAGAAHPDVYGFYHQARFVGNYMNINSILLTPASRIDRTLYH